MPLLISLGHQRALDAVQRRLQPSGRLFAHLDDTFRVPSGDGGELVCGVAGCTPEVRWHPDPLWQNPDLEPSRRPAGLGRVGRSLHGESTARIDVAARASRDEGSGAPLGHPEFVATPPLSHAQAASPS